MKRFERWPLLPHEIAFGVFFGITLARLVPTQGLFSPLALLYSGLIATVVAVAVWCGKDGSEQRWRWRLGYYPVAMNIAYFTLGAVIPVFHPGKEDAWLQQLDLSLIGGNASLWLQRVTHPVLTDLLSACYLFFFPGLMLSWLHYFRRELPVLRAFIIGLFTVYGLGFIGYTFVPALGPYLDPAMAVRFDMPLTGGWITQFNDHLVREGSNKVDVFPSLHCGVTAFILFFYHRHSPAAFRWVLVPTAGLWMATLYLRYHYFVDVVAGFLLAAAALWLVRPTHSQKSP